MARRYTKEEKLAEVMGKRHEQGETYAEMVDCYEWEKKLMERRRKKNGRLSQYLMSIVPWNFLPSHLPHSLHFFHRF